MKTKRTKYERTKEDIKKAREEIDGAKELKKKQINLQLMIKDMPDPLKFVDQKNTAVDLRNSVKNWERKLEIAEVAAKKARVILRQIGEHVDEIIRPEFLQQTGGHHHQQEAGSDEEQFDN